MTYKFIQVTNSTGGAVATGALIPLGTVTARSMCGCGNLPTFVTSTGGIDTITVNTNPCEKSGYYKITFNISAVATAAGLVTVGLLANGTTTPVYTASETATAAGDTVNLTIVYMTRVLPNFLTGAGTPIQLINSGGALTSYVSNTIVEKVL